MTASTGQDASRITRCATLPEQQLADRRTAADADHDQPGRSSLGGVEHGVGDVGDDVVAHVDVEAVGRAAAR